MKKEKSISLILMLSLSLAMIISATETSASFQLASESVDNWSKSTTSVSISKDNYLRLNLAVSDETEEYVFISYLTFHSIFNLPLDVISYLNHNKKDDTADFGLQVQTSRGNFSLGLNGTFIVNTPFTDAIFVEVEEGEYDTTADFSSFLGDNVQIPLNFIPLVFPIDISGIPGVQKLELRFAPIAQFNASSYLETRVMNENLIFQNSEDVYINSFPVNDDFDSFSTEMRDLYLDIANVALSMSALAVEIVLVTDSGDFEKSFDIDLSSVNTSAILTTVGEILLLYVSSTFYLGDLALFVAIDSASFSFLGLLVAIVAFAGIAYWRKRKK